MTITVVNDRDKRRYEARQAGVPAAVADYIPTAELVASTHTEVQPGFEGRGIAGELVRQALQDVREQHLMVLAVCPFVTAFLARHPEDYDDLIYLSRTAAEVAD